ncbi:GrpB family protein [Rhizobium sp. BK376]|uniref:GrpB family protein n=1 Tax=Rhizobium sp. BK376 TaxID=2512149 RepID=UPI001042CB8F|nr:GrpB family protein [Rhizobium sp. BK376]TCR92774.1 GrpB-like predicted nucleotidyltransferase (UPF0157 family) [Rhizobium sp. BK376]
MHDITIVEHDSSWPLVFEMRRRSIAALLLPFNPEIHHFGSTSIPGLASKPRIDINAVFASEDELPFAIERIRTSGAYTSHGDPYDQGTWTFTRDETPYGTRLYLCAAGNDVHAKRLTFRDYLRVHPEAVIAYAALKRQLAAEARGNWNYYNGGKTEFVTVILCKARALQGAGFARRVREVKTPRLQQVT